eukprot:820059-Amphidinium_carterae.1
MLQVCCSVLQDPNNNGHRSTSESRIIDRFQKQDIPSYLARHSLVSGKSISCCQLIHSSLTVQRTDNFLEGGLELSSQPTTCMTPLPIFTDRLPAAFMQPPQEQEDGPVFRFSSLPCG